MKLDTNTLGPAGAIMRNHYNNHCDPCDIDIQFTLEKLSDVISHEGKDNKF